VSRRIRLVAFRGRALPGDLDSGGDPFHYQWTYMGCAIFACGSDATWIHPGALCPENHRKTAMIAIILSTCLLSDPEVCREQIIPLDSEVASTTRCVMTAPPHVAQWSVEHPEWRVVRWSCRPLTERDT
jgi:hypothetical protein